MDKWIKDTKSSAIGINLMMKDGEFATIVAFFRNKNRKISVCIRDNSYIFIETEGDNKNWKLCPSVPIEVVNEL